MQSLNKTVLLTGMCAYVQGESLKGTRNTLCMLLTDSGRHGYAYYPFY